MPSVRLWRTIYEVFPFQLGYPAPNSRYLQGWILAGISITVVEYDRLKKLAKYGVVVFILDNQYITIKGNVYCKSLVLTEVRGKNEKVKCFIQIKIILHLFCQFLLLK